MNKIFPLLVMLIIMSPLLPAAASDSDVMIIKIFAHPPAAVSDVQGHAVRSKADIRVEEIRFSKAPPALDKPEKQKKRTLPYELEILNSEGTVVYSQEFDFTKHMEIPLPKPGRPDSKKMPLRVELETPRALLTIPNVPGGQSVRIRSIDDTTEPVYIPLNTPETVSPDESSIPSPTPLQPYTFNLLIIASGYTPVELVNFSTRAEEIRTRVLTTEPFASRAADITVSIYNNTDSLGCDTGCFGIDRLMCCNETSVLTAANASGFPHDEIIVLHNTPTYAGGGYRDLDNYQTDSVSSYCMVYDGYYSAAMALHEFGHSFGNLCDEYSYGGEGYDYYDCANCRASCSDWADVSSVCTLSCDARAAFFRPEDSIMLDLGISTFNPPSNYHSLIPRLDYFTAGLPGDINGDGFLNLRDVITGLFLLSEISSDEISIKADVGIDGQIGMEEVIYGIHMISEETP